MTGADSTDVEMARLQERLDGLDRLTDAKFVTFRTLVDSQADKVALALASADKAVTKAEIATEKRFEAVNEFRAQLTDQAARFITRETFDARIKGIEQSKNSSPESFAARIDAVEKAIDRQQGRGAGLQAGWGYLVAGIGVIVLIVNFVFFIVAR